MGNHRTRLRDSRSWVFDLSLCLVGLALLAAVAPHAWAGGWPVALATLLGVPLVVVVARFPMNLDGEDGGIEIGFDSTVLMFLLCTFDARSAVAVWGVAVVVTQLTSGKRPTAQLFNIGVGLVAGAAAAVALHAVRGPAIGTPRELLAMVAAAAAYFFVDYVLSAISIAIDTGTPVRGHLVQAGTWVAVACFVPFDLIGYLAAVVHRDSPGWMLTLLVIPLITLLVSTRAIARSRENARRLTVLFEAAVRVQALHETGLIIEALLHDARRLVRMRDVEVLSSPPAAYEIGAQVRRGKDALWIVAPARDRARSTVGADQHALDALAVIVADAFARMQLTDDMVHYARHDPLTDLPNRGILLDRVAHALHLARRRKVRVALLFIDLDGFKPVNDRFGHAAGDAVLVDVAQRLTASVRESDTVARLGGDEFAILLEDVRDNEVDAAAERILAAIRSGAVVAGHQVPLGVSIGVAFGDTGRSAEHLLRNADMAMYQAKAQGKDQYVQYERSLGHSRVERLELLESLRASVAAGDLRLVYQPVVQVESGHIVGVEALARWTSNGVAVPPDTFIRAAEESGLVVALGDVVMDLAVADATMLREAAGGPLTMGINISPKQLREPAFVTKVEETLERLGGMDLVLEITERDYVGNEPESLAVMARLAERGVAFAIDDFGVGFSSIGYLQDMPVRIVKTDNSFSESIDRDERSCALLSSIAMMGHALGLDVVVEGIERASQLQHLREHVEAPYAQGYLLHRPMPAAEVAEVIRKNRGVTALVESP
ncbi:MAG TPA: EAL domain-containing protein [Nocardioides sp.]|uniref:putative bifunctional diguanylate cyclase/phosphodiesterase n=1 Tax=Nocardioides sp. TaxID=35761 RepID=UPI002E3617D4|nr:EAL domain-containing protein [Nocardioides sp.]HEX5087490.1 EAL domain-containing protein [Nocardioides sp.]